MFPALRELGSVTLFHPEEVSVCSVTHHLTSWWCSWPQSNLSDNTQSLLPLIRYSSGSTSCGERSSLPRHLQFRIFNYQAFLAKFDLATYAKFMDFKDIFPEEARTCTKVYEGRLVAKTSSRLWWTQQILHLVGCNNCFYEERLMAATLRFP